MKICRPAVLALATAFPTCAGQVRAQSPAPIFKGVTQVWTNGGVSSLTGLPGRSVSPIISGDNDATLPGLFAAIGSLGKGAALGVGHEGFLLDTANRAFHTLRFNRQAIAWLDRLKSKKVLVLSGHKEWGRLRSMSVLAGALRTDGFQVSELASSVTTTALKGVGVVVIGNAWGSFSSAELTSLENFVKAGGGLYLAGVGWSWNAYRSSLGLDAYPMNVLGRRFGLYWLSPGIHDPTNSSKGAPIFHTFYPNCSLYLPESAKKHLDSLLGLHATDLDVFLRGNSAERVRFLIAVGQVAIALAQLPTSGAVRSGFDTSLRGLLVKYPRWFSMAGSFDPSRDAALAQARAVLHANLLAALPLDAARRKTLESVYGIAKAHRDYLEIFRRYDMLLLDNRRLGGVQRLVVRDMLRHAQGAPKKMRRITVKSLWGKTSPDLSSAMALPGVNTFGVSMRSMENGFPKDVRALPRPTFTIALAHEVAHSIDAARNADAGYKARRSQLLKAAGLDNLQYLRSMIGGAFFQKAPQEFIASNANQWVIDSAHTLRLGITRFWAGKTEPIRQALFMLDTYASTARSGQLFETQPSGRILLHSAAITRDGGGRVLTIQSSAGVLRAVRDSAGRIQKLSAALPYGQAAAILPASIEAESAPFLGNASFRIRVGTPIPNGVAVLLLSSKAADQSLPSPLFTGRLLVDLGQALAVPVVTDARGSNRIAIPLPVTTSLARSRLYAQATSYRVHAFGRDRFAMSRGLELWLGKP